MIIVSLKLKMHLPY